MVISITNDKINSLTSKQKRGELDRCLKNHEVYMLWIGILEMSKIKQEVIVWSK